MPLADKRTIGTLSGWSVCAPSLVAKCGHLETQTCAGNQSAGRSRVSQASNHSELLRFRLRSMPRAHQRGFFHSRSCVAWVFHLTSGPLVWMMRVLFWPVISRCQLVRRAFRQEECGARRRVDGHDRPFLSAFAAGLFMARVSSNWEMLMNRCLVLALFVFGCGQQPKVASDERRPKEEVPQVDGIVRPVSGNSRQGPVRKNSVVHVAAVSPDGKNAIVSGEEDGALLWDIENGALVRTLADKHWIKAVTFSPDSQWILTGSADGTIALWSTKDGSQKFLKKGHQGSVDEMAFSLDGTRALSAGKGLIKVWDVTRADEMHIVSDDKYASVHAFSRDGRMAATAVPEREGVSVLDLPSGRAAAHLPVQAFSLAFSPTGRYLATAGPSGIDIWELTTGQRVKSLCEKRHAVSGDTYPLGAREAHFLPGDQQVLFTDGANRPKLWNFVKEEVRVLSCDVQPDHLVVCPRGTQALFSWSEFLVVWDLVGDDEVRTLSIRSLPEREGRPTTEVVFSANGKLGVWGRRDGSISVWDFERGRALQPLPGKGRVTKIGMSTDGSVTVAITAGLEGHTVGIWKTADGTLIRTFDVGFQSIIACLAISPDGRRGLIGEAEGQLKLWDLGTAKPVREFGNHVGQATRAAFLPDGVRAWCASTNGVVNLWDTESGRLLETLGEKGHTVFAGSPTGQLLLCCGETWTLWDMATGKLIRKVPKLGRVGLIKASLSPDGNLAICRQIGSGLFLVDTRSGEVTSDLSRTRMADGDWSVSFSPQGKLARFDTSWNSVDLREPPGAAQPTK